MKKIAPLILLVIFLVSWLNKIFILNLIATFCLLMIVAIKLSKEINILSSLVGEKVGGLISSTSGNLPELFISIFALKNNLIDLVKSGLLGSIIGNMLLVLGLSILFGGIKYKEQKFNKIIARTNFSLLFLALSSLIIASTISFQGKLSTQKSYIFSFYIAIILILIYLLGLIFSLVTHKNLFLVQSEENNNYNNIKKTNFIFIFILLILAYALSERLVNLINTAIINFKIPEKIIGIIIMPLIGNAAEYITAIYASLKDKINLSIEISIGSSMQLLLFTLPTIVIIAYLLGLPLTLVYSFYELIILVISIGLSFFVFQDGKSYWLEGAILLASYLIIIFGYWLI
ncbi:MAG: calcium/proton exchanger [Caloramator sp.]|nr:calcium/proton exchanger [Caloramator sp.]